MKLIQQVDVYAPDSLGIKDVLIAGEKIVAIENDLSSYALPDVEVIDGQGQILVPGFVDSLVHITGGGGEGGFATRTPEMSVEDALKGGVTTVIGVLGTDSISRSLENLLAKSYALEEQGISVFSYTGSYHVPAVNVTGSITKDIMMIEKFIGIGEVAIADHRGSQLTVAELARLASEARVGGMLSNKAGIVSIHVGDEESGLSLLHSVANETDIPITQFYPTHINRTGELLAKGIDYAKQGGFIDLTTSTNEQILASGEVKAARALAMALEQGVPVANITMSSDGNASLPVFDEAGKLTDLQVGEVRSLHEAMVEAVKVHKVDLSSALASISSTPANILKLTNKGRIYVGADADLNLLDKESLEIISTIAKGISH
ncbi:beta-aspartyl-peptidase [Thalassotalea agarivorans]|uniref:Isoaspartyl dipeptidase n=1 Tax=Thalassotalea agarivorans TaxID=349064 RepID=A0A1H9YGY4_THASX|nr:beta-aspartyl-peptidase [Thalassotalea agarivorans]SES68194.1 beta-aspartyl-dipeptidase (metallo-type) [Thalassotalea agarivorans]